MILQKKGLDFKRYSLIIVFKNFSVEKSLSDQIAALGSRRGIYNQGTFRSTIQGLLRARYGGSDRKVRLLWRPGDR